MEEVKRLRGTLDRQWSDILGISSRMSSQKNAEMAFILNQINPAPPDYDLKREESQEKALEALERLVEFRKSGLLDEDELSSFKKFLLRKWKHSVSAP